MGVNAVGIEANSFLCFVTKVKTENYDFATVKREVEEILNKLKKQNESEEPLSTPIIFDYFSPEIAAKLMAIKKTVLEIKSAEIRNLFLLCLASLIVPASNAKRSPALRFARSKESFNVFKAFEKKLRMIVQDVRSSERLKSSINVCFSDSRNLPFIPDSFDLILTSPPYCNNVDFIRHLQLEMFWLDFARGTADLRRLRKLAITSCEAMAYVGKDNLGTVRDVEKIATEIAKKTKRRWPQMVSQYFSGMKSHFESVRRVIKPRGKALYVVGDSWIKGVYVPTPKILAKIAQECGFKRVKITTLRYRTSGRQHRKQLNEYLLRLS